MVTAAQITQMMEGGMVADALGVPVEFSRRGTYHVTGMQGHGTYDQPAGSWSDDSSLTLCLMENVNESGDFANLFDKMAAYTRGRYTPRGIMFDIGHTTSAAIARFITGTPPLDCGDPAPDANGNGALMRIAPLGLVLLTENDAATRRQVISDTTRLTHAHVRAIIGSVLFVELLRALLRGETLTNALGPVFQQTANSGFPAHEMAYYRRLADPAFGQTAPAAIRSSGYVVDTLEAAVWVNLRGTSFRETVLTAVNLGDDTDTVAQIAAMIYGAGHPEMTIPQEWSGQLMRTTLDRQIIAHFAKRYAEP